MEMADVLYGVSMQADGVSKVVSQKLDRALEHVDGAS
jgi:chromosome segregation protein